MDRETAERVLRRDQCLNKRYPAREGGPLRMSISPEAVANAVRTEGPEVMGADGEGYWRDMRRMYPHLDMQPERGPGPRRYNRFGRVKERWVCREGKMLRVA